MCMNILELNGCSIPSTKDQNQLLVNREFEDVFIAKPGILRKMTMDNKLIYIPNDDKQIIPSEDKNYY